MRHVNAQMLGQPRGIVTHGVMSWIVLEAINQNDCHRPPNLDSVGILVAVA